jgi:hypothetical protein
MPNKNEAQMLANENIYNFIYPMAPKKVAGIQLNVARVDKW